MSNAGRGKSDLELKSATEKFGRVKSREAVRIPNFETRFF